MPNGNSRQPVGSTARSHTRVCQSPLRRLDFGGFLQAVSLYGGLAQPVLLDLATRRHRVLIYEVHVEGDLEAGYVLLAILFEVFFGEAGVRLLLYYYGGDLFAVLLVRDAVYLHVGDVRVGVEELLDLARVDVLAAPDDHVLRPARDPNVPVLVHDRQVACVQPAVVVYDLGRLVLHLVVPLHDEVPPGPQLALLARLAVSARLDADYTHLGLGQRTAHGRDPQLERVVGACLGDNGAGLGLAVSYGDLRRPHDVNDLLHHLHRARRTGHYSGPQRARVVILEVGMLELCYEHSRHTEHRRAPLLVHSLQDLLRVE